jgi:glycosyltransferase involved in cell wall biosynthesis
VSDAFTKRRILIVCDSYPPVLGGSEIEAQRVAAGLIARGHAVRVLCSGGGPMPKVRDWVDPAGVPVSILTKDATGRTKDRVFALQVARELIARRNEYDIVYFLMQGLHLAAGLPTARLLGKSIVMKISGDGIVTTMRQSRVGRLELDWLLKWRIPVMLLNDNMMREAEASGFPRAQLVWMPNPVEIDKFRPAQDSEASAWRTSHGLPADGFFVVYTGRLSHEKGIRELFQGFARASAEVPDARLILVGDGPMRAELEAFAADLGVADRIKFVGRVPLMEVPFWLRAGDVFALTSPNEGFSCALVEAMASGLACVVSDIPANRQLVADGVQGVTVPFDGIERIAAAFVRLARNPGERQAMGAAARLEAEKYSIERVVERYEDLFAQAAR